MGNKADILLELRCWRNRKVLLYRSTMVGHVVRLHLESAFVVDAMKLNFSSPLCVIDNIHNGTENAIYDIPNGGHPWLLVAIKFQKPLGKFIKPNFIKTFYGVSELPAGPLIWGKKP